MQVLAEDILIYTVRANRFPKELTLEANVFDCFHGALKPEGRFVLPNVSGIHFYFHGVIWNRGQ